MDQCRRGGVELLGLTEPERERASGENPRLPVLRYAGNPRKQSLQRGIDCWLPRWFASNLGLMWLEVDGHALADSGSAGNGGAGHAEIVGPGRC